MRDRRSPVTRGRQQGQRGEKHRASVDSNTSEEQCHPRKIFIGGLAHKTTTQHLRDHFGKFGSIVDAVVLRWPDGRSRGFGYVTFADSGAAALVLKENHSLSGRDVDVKRAVPGTNKLFVGGLPQNTTANELREHFEKFGVVSDAVVMIDPATSRSRGFGFVCFLPGQEGAAAVTASLAAYDSHRIRGKWIEVKSAAPPHKLAAKSQDAQPSYEELALAGALPPSTPSSRPASSPTPSVENREPNERRSTLGSPRKVEIPTAGSLGQPMKASPPGLIAPGFGKDMDMPMPWWTPQPWVPPFGPAGFGAMPPFGVFPPTMPHAAPLEAGYLGTSLGTEQPKLLGSEMFTKNLELFLRQSMMEKDAKLLDSPRDHSVTSTTCSSATQTEVAQSTALVP